MNRISLLAFILSSTVLLSAQEYTSEMPLRRNHLNVGVLAIPAYLDMKLTKPYQSHLGLLHVGYDLMLKNHIGVQLAAYAQNRVTTFAPNTDYVPDPLHISLSFTAGIQRLHTLFDYRNAYITANPSIVFGKRYISAGKLDSFNTALDLYEHDMHQEWGWLLGIGSGLQWVYRNRITVGLDAQVAYQFGFDKIHEMYDEYGQRAPDLTLMLNPRIGYIFSCKSRFLD